MSSLGRFLEIHDTLPAFLARQKKKDFPFFPLGDPVQNRPQNPAPAGCLFSTRKSRLRSQKEAIIGKIIAWGRVGGQGKKGKRVRKKGGHWVFERDLIPGIRGMLGGQDAHSRAHQNYSEFIL